ARRLLAGGREAHEGGEHHRHPALHVQCTTAPEISARELARERRMLPLLARWHDVDMPLQKQRRALSPSAQPCDQIGALGLLRENANLYAEALEQPLHPGDALSLASGRIGRIEAQQLREQFGWSLVELLCSHRS